MNDPRLKEQEDPYWGFSPRKAMELIGTDFARNMLHPDFTILRANMAIQEAQANGIAGLLITDVRVENEAEWIRSRRNSVLVHIESPQSSPVIGTTPLTERGISFDPARDLRIVNDKSKGLAYLHKQIEALL